MGAIIGLVAKNFQLVLYVGIAAVISYGAWTVKTRFARAAEADRIEAESAALQLAFAAEQEKLKAADSERINLAADLEIAKIEAKKKASATSEAIKAAVQDRDVCEIPVEVLKAFNAQMGHEP